MEKQRLNPIHSSLSFLIAFFACQLGVFIFSFIGSIICVSLNIDISVFSAFLENPYGYLLNTIIFDLCLFVVFAIFNVHKENKIVSKVSGKKILIYSALAILSFFMLYPIITCIDTLLVNIGFPLNSISYELNLESYLVSIVSLVILPAVVEELLFRGLILKGLKNNGKVFSIIISAIMFALFHMSLGQLVYPLVMGTFLGLIMYREDNVIYTILIHAINNFLSLTLSYLNINLVFNHWTYILLAVILFAIYLGVLLYFVIRKNKNTYIKLEKTEQTYLIVSLVIMLILYIVFNIANF